MLAVHRARNVLRLRAWVNKTCSLDLVYAEQKSRERRLVFNFHSWAAAEVRSDSDSGLCGLRTPSARWTGENWLCKWLEMVNYKSMSDFWQWNHISFCIWDSHSVVRWLRATISEIPSTLTAINNSMIASYDRWQTFRWRFDFASFCRNISTNFAMAREWNERKTWTSTRCTLRRGAVCIVNPSPAHHIHL